MTAMPNSYDALAKVRAQPLVRIECTCKTCKTNAAKIGASFPLKADVPEGLANKVGKQTHGLVYDAHNPDFFGQTMRNQTGIRPVA